jgi:hypothetical protein
LNSSSLACSIGCSREKPEPSCAVSPMP